MAEVTRLRVEEVAVERPTIPQPMIAPLGPPIEQAAPREPVYMGRGYEVPPVITFSGGGSETRSKPSDEAMEAAFKAVGFALSARALLFLALVGSFVLALLAMVGDSARLWVLGTYCVLVILPLVFLEVRKGR